MQDESPARSGEPISVAGSEDAGQRVYGVIDVLRAGRIGGWAIDRASSSASVEVDVLREGALIGTVRADRHRADLERGGIGTGHYGFVLDIDPPLDPGLEFTITATARSADGARAVLRNASPAQRPASPELFLLQRLYERGQAPARILGPDAQTAARMAHLADMLARVELVQTRIEATLAGIDAPAPPPADRAARRIGTVALVFAAGSIALGLFSLLQP